MGLKEQIVTLSKRKLIDILGLIIHPKNKLNDLSKDDNVVDSVALSQPNLIKRKKMKYLNL